MIFRRKVQHGNKLGRQLGFPTLNLNVGNFGNYYKPAVYACQIHINGKEYKGALHFGPKQRSKKFTLEIHVLNFNHMIYGDWVSFQVEQRIRPPKDFSNLNALKNQIESDVDKIRNL